MSQESHVTLIILTKLREVLNGEIFTSVIENKVSCVGQKYKNLVTSTFRETCVFKPSPESFSIIFSVQKLSVLIKIRPCLY